jgi:hypothetical protein
LPWFKIDDGFWSHPKTLQLSDGAQALWMRAGSWSMDHLTDGFVPDFALPVLRAKPRYVNELRAVSLWFSTKDGNQFHDWDKYQPTKEQVESDRDAAAERKRKSREKSRRDMPVTGDVSSPDAAHTPTRPDPTHSSSKEEETPRKRGSRVPKDFTITPEMRAWAREEVPLIDLDAKLNEWVDYWTGVAGAKGVKSDWPATWRNGMRKQQEFATRDLPATGRRDPDAWMNA